MHIKQVTTNLSKTKKNTKKIKMSIEDTSQILQNQMEYNSSEWQPVSLTFVEYQRGW